MTSTGGFGGTPAAPGPEARISARFRIDAPVEFEGGSGVTRDMGSAGVFFRCSQAFEEGSPIEFSIVLPGTEAGGKPLRLRCSGEVVRVERDGEQIGVAARILERRFDA